MTTSITKETLGNGLTLLSEAMPHVRSISMGVMVRTGSRHERPAENGITHFLEHLVFKGTKNRTAEQIAHEADAIGGHLDAFTTKEFTAFSIKVLDEHLPKAIDILADLVNNPLFKPEHIAKESKVVQEEIKMVQDTPDDLVHEIFTQTYWRGHSLGRPILGTRQTVRSFNRAHLLSYFRRHYTPRNTLIAAAGHLEQSRLVDLIAKKFGDLSAGSPAPNVVPPVPHPHITQRHKKELEQVHICIGSPCYPQPHEKRYSAYILNTVLGGGMSSRLFQNIREKHGLVYAIFSGLNCYRDTGYLAVYAGTGPGNARQVIDMVLKEFRDLKSKGITKEELQHAKDYLKGSLLLSLESSGSRMSNLARQEMYFGRHFSLDEVARSVDAVTVEQVQETARNFFAPDRLAVTVLGPPNGLKLTRSDLEC